MEAGLQEFDLRLHSYKASQAPLAFELGLIGSGLGLMFHERSPSSHHTGSNL